MVDKNLFSSRSTLSVGGATYRYLSLQQLEQAGLGPVTKLPVTLKILLEAMARKFDGKLVTEEHIARVAKWRPGQTDPGEIPFMPARVLLQDFTGVPVVVDLAALRQAMADLGGDPGKINPIVPIDLIIDHSVQVDVFGTPEAFQQNVDIEFERNVERYKFLHWATEAFKNFRVVPPATGICHQINLEYVGRVVMKEEGPQGTEVWADSLVGCDSHTTMINGIGVLGWGVGGIEAEAVMLGQPLYMVTPEVIGVRLTGTLPEGSTATDLALTVTNVLRKKGVVGKLVEFFGRGLDTVSAADRATVGNMSPEYGATCAYFPIDKETLRYLRMTGRSDEHVALVETYAKAQGLFRDENTPDPEFTDVVELDLASIRPSLAGPRRPQDKIEMREMKQRFEETLTKPIKEGGFGLTPEQAKKTVPIQLANGEKAELKQGSVVISAITSCTNTSNPDVMLAAGLLAKKAFEKGLKPKPYVKTSLAPGSRVVTNYYDKTGLTPYLDKMGFNLVGYGCTTCIGNSGPLIPEVADAVQGHELTVAAVLSGNRNFEGRIHPLVKANYLASPPLLMAYGLAGTVDWDPYNEPLGTGSDGQPVFLKDIWPTSAEVEALKEAIGPEMYKQEYANVLTGNERWNNLPTPKGELYDWDEESTYIRLPSFLEGITPEAAPVQDIIDAPVLALMGDSVTTDHISPAGSIPSKGPAGKYLIAHGVQPADFNSYGTRRGNHEVMMRGTFANIRIRNQTAPGTEGGVTTYFPTGEVMPIYDAAEKYQAAGTPTIVIAGKEYGTGSSRDWAAKGTLLLGAKAVLAESFERIHRSNLVGMGVLPLQFEEGQSWRSLGITGRERFTIKGLSGELAPRQTVTVTAKREDGSTFEFKAIVRLDSVVDVEVYQQGGILPMVVRNLVGAEKSESMKPADK